MLWVGCEGVSGRGGLFVCWERKLIAFLFRSCFDRCGEEERDRGGGKSSTNLYFSRYVNEGLRSFWGRWFFACVDVNEAGGSFLEDHSDICCRSFVSIL